MKAISIRQPWVWAILRGGKTVENRAWKYESNFRGAVLIHAASGCTRAEYFDAELSIEVARRDLGLPSLAVPKFSELQRGGLIGIARIVDVRRNPEWPDNRGYEVEGALGLILEDIEELPFIAAKGSLGFFNVGPWAPPREYTQAWDRLTAKDARDAAFKRRQG